MNYQIYVSNFLLCLLANRQWYFQQSNHGMYSNPDTQVGAEKKGFWRCFVDGLNQS